MLLVRASWYHNSPNEEYSKHYQIVCDERLENEAVTTVLNRAWYDGIHIPPREVIRIPHWGVI